MSELDDLEVVSFCPYGKKCKEIKDNKIYVCNFNIELEGNHPQTGEPIKQSQCAIVAQSIASLEVARTNRGQTAALESLRNVVKNGNDNLYDNLLGGK